MLRCTQEEFNPRPATQKHLNHSLVDLLGQVCLVSKSSDLYSYEVIEDREEKCFAVNEVKLLDHYFNLSQFPNPP